MQTTYRFYEDPGHGWLAVKRSELSRLGLTDKISSYSYQRGEVVYLKEDCDAGLFLNAKRLKGEEVRIRDNHTNRRSRIRSYSSYSPAEGRP